MSDSTESTSPSSVATPISSSMSLSIVPSTDAETLAGADSMPHETDTIATDDSPKSVLLTIAQSIASDVNNIRAASALHDCQPELERVKELEKKRLALRQQRFSLEQRLYDFCGKHQDTPEQAQQPVRHVMDFVWKDKTTGVRVLYSGPLNEREEPHGHDGILKFGDGQIFRGDIRNGLRWGKGTNSWADGQDYSGEWQNNSRNGRGTHRWPDGRQVTGMWREGHLHGKVYFRWPNGATFDGECRQGKKHGRGVHTWADGRVYNGHFEDGKEHGFGTLTFPDNVKYRGQFKYGAKHGYGIQLWKTRTYDGEWNDNKPHGQGRVVWSNGATYTGQFSDGKYHGLGVYVWPNGKKFVGRWQNGVKEGHGLYTWPNGKKYDGEYKNGVKHGYGRMQWADGRMYCGGWKENVRSGRGIQTEADGTVVHCGMWKNDEPIGSTEPVQGGIPAAFEIMQDTPKVPLRPGQSSGETSGEYWLHRKGLDSEDVDDEEENHGIKLPSSIDMKKDRSEGTCSPTHASSIDELSNNDCSAAVKYDTPLVRKIAPNRLIL